MTTLTAPLGGIMHAHRHNTVRATRRLLSKGSRVLDRASESGIAQLSAVSLALFGLATAGSLVFFPARYNNAPSFEVVFALAHPGVWAGVFTVAAGALLYGAAREKDFTVGALIGLMAVHTIFGVLTIPAFLFGNGLPTAFLQYAGNGVWCFITFLLWSLRIRGRS